MSSAVTMPDPWDANRTPLTLDGKLKGRDDLAGWRQAVPTARQQLSGSLRLVGYRLVAASSAAGDFYAISGSMSHGVTGAPDDPSKNWVSVGYYGLDMSLRIDMVGHPEHDVLWDAGPTSTVGSNSVSFNIGGNLSGGVFAGETILQGGVSAGFGTSFASPDVAMAMSQAAGQAVSWRVSLPKVGFISPGSPANPKPASYSGYTWYFGAIYAVARGAGLRLSVHPTVRWEYDYTRGITYDTRTWDVTQAFTLA
jgi:hypothetical protein